MSLINEALKKAQRQRTELPATVVPVAGDATTQSTAKHAPAARGQTVLLIFAGSAMLIMLSVVITVFLVNRPAPTLDRPAPIALVTPSVDLNAPSPVIVAPALTSASVAAAATEPASVNSAPAPLTPAISAAAVPASVMSGSSADSAAPDSGPVPSATLAAANAASETSLAEATPPVFAEPNPSVAVFVDSVRVTGIRSSGNESKVLMNDRVYRVNDIVDRTLGVRLVRVAPEALTFSDANGTIYTKYF